MLYKIIRKFNFINSKKKNNKYDLTYSVGSINITIPFGHALPIYQEKYRLYDKKIGYISKLIYDENPLSIILDIGANVGDTAATIRNNCNIQIIAIEGNPVFLPYLRLNASVIGNIEIVEKFVGDTEDININYSIESHAGTGKLVKTDINFEQVNFDTIENIIKKCKFERNQVRLIKIDTDGFDFKILLANKKIIEDVSPILFFEYDISFFTDGEEMAKKIIDYLIYRKYGFIVYDNFGNLLETIINPDTGVQSFEKINNYIKSCLSFGGGIYYVDILAIPIKNIDLLKKIVAMDTEMIDIQFKNFLGLNGKKN